MDKSLKSRNGRKNPFATKLFQAHMALQGRVGHRISQAEMAEALGCDQTTVGSWFRGQSPRLEHLRAVAKYYGVPVGFFFDEEPAIQTA